MTLWRVIADFPDHEEVRFYYDNSERRGVVTQRITQGQTRQESIRKRLRALETELFQLERFGGDTWDDGTVLTWKKTFPAAPNTVYNFAAIKVDEHWFLTGSTIGNPTTWDKMVEIWVTANVVDEVYVVTETLPLTQLVEALAQLDHGEGVEVDMAELLRAASAGDRAEGEVRYEKVDVEKLVKDAEK